jgi:hypothetical protein
VSALAVEAVAAITPVGEDAPATVGSIFTEVQVLEMSSAKGADERPVGAATPIPATVKGVDRLVALGGFALREAALGLAKGTEIGLVACVPSEKDEPGLVAQASSFLSRLAAESDLAMAPKAGRVFGAGPSAIIEALLYARATLQMRDLSAVFVLGVDSLVSAFRRRKALQDGSVPVEGLVPGEAAAAILLSGGPGPDSLATLAGVGLAEEPSLGVQPAGPNLGKGINSAIDRAVADAKLPNALFAALVHDLPSSQAGFAELAWVKGCPSLRTSPEVHIVSPTFSTGATGAASGILSLVTLAYLIEKKVIADLGLCLFAAESRGEPASFAGGVPSRGGMGTLRGSPSQRGVAILTPPPHRKVARR